MRPFVTITRALSQLLFHAPGRRLLPAAVSNPASDEFIWTRSQDQSRDAGRDLWSLAGWSESGRLSLISRFVGNGRLNRQGLQAAFRVTKQRRCRRDRHVRWTSLDGSREESKARATGDVIQLRRPERASDADAGRRQ